MHKRSSSQALLTGLFLLLPSLVGAIETLYRIEAPIVSLLDVDTKEPHVASAGWYYTIIGENEEEFLLRFKRHSKVWQQKTKTKDGVVSTHSEKVEFTPQRNEVIKGRTYRVSKSELKKVHKKLIQSLDVGVLAVPFKYRRHAPGATNTATNESTIGASVGGRFALGGVDALAWLVRPQLFFGLTQISVEGAADGVVQERVGVTVGTGVIFEAGGAYQLGAVIGWDRLADGVDVTWPYQDRPWFSFAIGYKFLGGKTD